MQLPKRKFLPHVWNTSVPTTSCTIPIALAVPKFCRINHLGFNDSAKKISVTASHKNSSCVLILNQVENGGNYPNNLSKTWQNYCNYLYTLGQTFSIFFYILVIISILLFGHMQSIILPFSKIKQRERQVTQNIF